jgi:hypothetical protein
MTTSNSAEPKVLLEITRSGWSRLIPEQSALFEVSQKNAGGAPVTLASLNNNRSTPTVRAFDASGQLLAEGTPEDLIDSIAGHMGEPVPVPLSTVTLAAGAAQKSPVELWHFMRPLRPGHYSVEVAHEAGGGSSATLSLSSTRAPFEIVPASVDTCALGYESSQRLATILAWIATPSDTKEPELFARSSGASHASVRLAGRAFGRVAPGSTIAVSHVPPDAMTTWLGWVAVVSGSQIELIQHTMGAPGFRSGPIALNLSGAAPVPRFPDRTHAVALVTGLAGDRPTLAGVVVRPNAAPASPWTVPLSALPKWSACSFTASGPIAVLLIADDGATTRFTRLDVEETGVVAKAEHTLRTSPNEVIAAVMDIRPNSPPMLLVLEANRTTPDRIALVRVPLAGGQASVTPFAPLKGWPYGGDGASARPLRAKEVALDAGWDGVLRVALTDELGRLFSGALDGTPLRLMRDITEGPARCPQIGSLRRGATPGAFVRDGSLFMAVNEEEEQ